MQGTTIIVGGDDRFLNYTTLVNGLSTVREFDFGKGEIVYARNISSPRWYAIACLVTSRSGGSCHACLVSKMDLQQKFSFGAAQHHSSDWLLGAGSTLKVHMDTAFAKPLCSAQPCSSCRTALPPLNPV